MGVGLTGKKEKRKKGMIEDVDLTKRILKETADAKVFPANLDTDMLVGLIYPDESRVESMREKIRYHVILARENGFIFGGEYTSRSLGPARIYRVEPVDGLTCEGLAYLGYSESKNIWDKALEAFRDATVKVTSQELAKVVTKIGTGQISNLLS